jgi:hypothetical protein
VYRDDYDRNENAITATALIRAYGAQLLTALVLQILVAKLRVYLTTCDAPHLQAADHDALEGGIRFVRDLASVHAEPDRLSFIRSLIGVQTRALTLFRTGREPPADSTRYQAISDRPVGRIPSDPGLETNGMRELAAGLGLIGRVAEGHTWSIDLASTDYGHRGVLRLVTADGENAVFFAANPQAGVELEVSGAAPAHAEDVVVLYSTGPVRRLRRSPRGRFGRTGRARARYVNMRDVLRDARNVCDLERRFRQEAVV